MSGKVKTRVETALGLLTEAGTLAYGTLIPIERFEEVFSCQRDSQEFNWLISGIRRALYTEGKYISGEGISETGGYEIVPAHENFYIAKLAMARAERDLAGKQTLLVNTKLDGMTPLQVARHENVLRLLSLRLEAVRKVQEHNARTERRRKEVIEETSEDS